MHTLLRHLNHNSIVLDNTVHLATMEMIQQSSNTIASGHQIDVNDVTILDREENWFERGVNEAVWDRTKNPFLDCNGATRMTLSHSWDRSINTLRNFSTFPISSGNKNSTGKQHQHQLSQQPQP